MQDWPNLLLLLETNEIVKEIHEGLSNLNCGGSKEDCYGPGFSIKLCANETQYCSNCEGKYCMVDGNSTWYYNPVKNYDFYSCQGSNYRKDGNCNYFFFSFLLFLSQMFFYLGVRY